MHPITPAAIPGEGAILNPARQTVLIVDDHPTNLQVLFDILKGANLSVRVATNGEAALVSIRHSPPDIILLDVMMPGPDGFEVCRRLKADPQTRDIPVIFMTAFSEPVDEVKGLQLGAVDYITKPLNVETVLARIETHLSLERLQREMHHKNRELAQTNLELQRRVEELSALNLIVQTAVTSNDLNDLNEAVQTIVNIMARLFEAECTYLALMNETQTALVTVTTSTSEKESGRTLAITEQSALHQLLTEKRPRVLSPSEQPPALQAICDQPTCHLIVPLLLHNNSLGIIGIVRAEANPCFTSEAVRLAETIAGQLAGVIGISRLFKEEQRQRHINHSLQNIAIALNSTLDQHSLLTKILETLGCVIEHDGAAIFLKQGSDLVITSGANLSFVDVGFRVPLNSQDPVARVFRQQETIIFDDASDEATWHSWNEAEPIRSWMGSPLIFDRQSIGVLTVDNFQKEAYGPADAQILQTYAHHAAVAIRNVRQVERTEAALYQTGLFYRMGNILARMTDIQESLGKVLPGYLWALNLAQGCLCLFEGADSSEAYIICDDDQTQPQPPLYHLDQIPAIRQKILETSRPLIIEDASTDSLLVDCRDMVNEGQLKSLLIAPLIIRGEVIGLLSGWTTEEPRYFTEQEADIAQTVAGQIATAVENARLYQEEKRQRQRAEEQNRELDAFAHTVAHNLKNSLGVVVSYADYLTHYSDRMRPEFFEEAIKTILEAGSKGASIVDELLILAGVRKQAVTLAPLDMADIVHQATQRLSFMIETYHGELITPATWPEARGYGPWVEEVWVNYLSNALKYGGQPPRLVLGAAPQADGMVRFWVQDNGEGITAEKQSTLFTEFTRLNEVRARGHGLGLSIVRRIIAKLGGQVGVESEGVPGQGCRFYFTLPAPVEP